MATRSIGSWEGGLIRAELDYDGANRITAVRVINESDKPIYIEAVQADAVGTLGRKYSSTFLPHTSTEIPVPTSIATRLEQLWDAARQRWDGISIMAVV